MTPLGIAAVGIAGLVLYVVGMGVTARLVTRVPDCPRKPDGEHEWPHGNYGSYTMCGVCWNRYRRLRMIWLWPLTIIGWFFGTVLFSVVKFTMFLPLRAVYRLTAGDDITPKTE